MAQGSAERRGDGGSRAEAPGDVKTGEQRQQRQNTNAATSSRSRDGDIRGRHNNTLANPFSDHAVSDDELSLRPAAGRENENTINDDSWSSTSTRRPRVSAEAAIARSSGTPGAAVDPQRASTPRRAAFASSDVENPFRSPDRPHANKRSVAGASGFYLSAPPRLLEPPHTAPQRDRHFSDTHQRGRETAAVASTGGGRDESRSTMATVGSSGGTSLPYTTAPTSRQTSATARSGGNSLADPSLTSPFPSADADSAGLSPAHGRNDSVQGTKDGKMGPNDKGLKGLKEKKSMKDMFGSLSRAFGRKATRPTGGERDGVRKSSGLTSLFAGKRRHAEPSTELKPFPTDSQLNLAFRSPPIAIAVGGGARGLALPSGGIGSGIGSYRATSVGPSPFVAPTPVFGSASGGQRPDPYANKPLPPSPPNGEETPKGRGKRKEVKRT